MTDDVFSAPKVSETAVVTNGYILIDMPIRNAITLSAGVELMPSGINSNRTAVIRRNPIARKFLETPRAESRSETKLQTGTPTRRPARYTVVKTPAATTA